MARAGRWCPEHRNGYDDCSFLHGAPHTPVANDGPRWVLAEDAEVER